MTGLAMFWYPCPLHVHPKLTAALDATFVAVAQDIEKAEREELERKRQSEETDLKVQIVIVACAFSCLCRGAQGTHSPLHRGRLFLGSRWLARGVSCVDIVPLFR